MSFSYFLACLLLTFLLVFFLFSCSFSSYFPACLFLTFLLVFFLLSHLSSSYFLAYLLLTFLLVFFLLSHSPYLLADLLWALITDHILRQTHVKMRKTCRKTHIKTHRIEVNVLANYFISSLQEQLQRILNMKIIWCIIIWFILRFKVRLIIWWIRYHLMI